MSNAPLVRRLQPADVEDYRRIRLATLTKEPEFFGVTLQSEAERPLAHFAGMLASSAVFGAYSGKDIVGVIRFTRATGPKELHKGSVHGFFVEPEQRQRGVGSALMTRLIDTARDVVEQLTLSVIRDNRAAIALYERFGFATYGVEPRARRSAEGYRDMVLMALRLK
ncbi:MAG: GNAT family N-acetyltransferase [Alphaproteobacteria bacterium]|nr:GNAT family N-acetyltransferase [Alphaproteobacteria bacterium]